MKNSRLRMLIWKGAAALAALLVCSCAPTTTDPGPQDKVEASIVKKPEIRFLIEGDLYAVPIAVDADGCEQFTTWSQSGAKSLAQPIYFLDGEGSFTPSKTNASCSANMIETDIDGAGCRMFRAVQPDGTSSEVTYYRSKNGYTVKRDRSICG